MVRSLYFTVFSFYIFFCSQTMSQCILIHNNLPKQVQVLIRDTRITHTPSLLIPLACNETKKAYIKVQDSVIVSIKIPFCGAWKEYNYQGIPSKISAIQVYQNRNDKIRTRLKQWESVQKQITTISRD